MFSTWFIVTCSLTCAAGVLYTYLELSSSKFLLECTFVHFLYPSLPPRWWAESFISSGVLSVFRFTWNKSLFMPNKWCVLFYWLLVCLDIRRELLPKTKKRLTFQAPQPSTWGNLGGGLRGLWLPLFLWNIVLKDFLVKYMRVSI